jgi:hypothetical protein
MLRAGLKKIGRAILLPPFPVVLGLSAALLCAFVGWVYFDPWFAIIFDLLKPAQRGPGEVVSWEFLRPTFQPRVTAFVALRIAALVVTILAFIGLFFGRRSGRSISAWLLMTALLGAWLGFMFGYENVRDAGFRHRTRARLPELQSIADAINSHRGPENEIKTDVGAYTIDPVRSGTFALRGEWWTANVPFFIVRLTDGGLLLIFSAPSRFYVEHHPDGEPTLDHIPKPLPSLAREFTALTYSEPLGDGWYLTKYAD